MNHKTERKVSDSKHLWPTVGQMASKRAIELLCKLMHDGYPYYKWPEPASKQPQPALGGDLQTDVWTYEQTDGQTEYSSCVLQDIIPYRARCPKNTKEIYHLSITLEY